MSAKHNKQWSTRSGEFSSEYQEDERTPLFRKTFAETLVEDERNVDIASVIAMSKRKCIKNQLILCFSIFLVFLGFQSLSNLQSTMNSKKDVGTDSLAVMYGFAMISAIFLPNVFINRFGVKSTIVVMVLLGLPYIAANFYPVWQLLIPSAVFIGTATSPLNAANSVYINGLARRYSSHVVDNIEVISSRLFGIYAFFTESTQIWGNLISYLVLKPCIPSDILSNNITDPKCGVNFDQFYTNSSNSSNSNLEPPTNMQRYVLVGIYTSLCLLASIIIAIFLDDFDDYDNLQQRESKSFLANVLDSIKQMKNIDQILLLPATVYIGLEMAFYTVDFTKAYIACSWGIYHVGFVTICYGVCAAVTAVLLGSAVKLCGQTFIIVIIFFVSMASCVFLYFWIPDTRTTTTYFIFAGVWGACDAVWWSQISALYGITFPDNTEAAFSNLFFWTSTGSFLSYLNASYLTISMKLAILLSFLVVGLLGYSVSRIRMSLLSSHKYEVVVST